MVWGHESGKSLLLVTVSEAVDYRVQSVAFSGEGKLAKSELNNGKPSQTGSGSSQGFAPKKPKEKSSCIDWIDMAGIRECLRLYL